MNLEQKTKLLTLIAERQKETASIEIRIGGVSKSGHVIDDNITILKSAPAFFDLLAEFKASEKAEGRNIFIEAEYGGINVW